jgi:methionine-rich copper-binding protein CopC
MLVKARVSGIALAYLLGMAIFVLLPVKVSAHAVLVESKPNASSTVKGPGLDVWLRFNVRVDGSRSRCTLWSPDGQSKTLQLDPQTKPEILTGKASGLSAGKYKLVWQVLASDGHISRGEFSFTVEQ